MGLPEKVQFLYDEDGHESHVVIPINFYKEIQEYIEDAEDAKVIKERKKEKGISLDEVEKKLREHGKL